MDILLFLLEFSALISVFYFITGSVFTKKPLRLACASLLFIAHLASPFIYRIGYPDTFILFPIILLLFEEKISYKICWLTICTLGEVTIVYLILNIYCILTNTIDYTMNNRDLMQTLDGITFLAFILCAFCCRKKQKKITGFLHTINTATYILIIIIGILAFILLNTSQLIFAGNLSHSIQYTVAFSTYVLISALIILIIALVSTNYRNLLLKQQEIANQKILKLEKKHYIELEDKNKDLRAFRHDFNGHIIALNKLLLENDYDRIAEYIHTLSFVQAQNNYISTGNIIADATFNHFYDILDANILFKVSGYFPENCFVNDFDLCSIISNLVKNAFEAVEKVSSDQKAIYFNIDASPQRILLLQKTLL